MRDPDADHDLLVEINSNLRFVLENQKKHEIDDAAKHAVLDAAIKSAHKRVDWLTVSGVLSIVFMGITLWFKK